MTIREYRHQFTTATAAEIVAMRAAEPLVAKPSSAATYVTYISIGKIFDKNVAAAMCDALEAWFDLPDLSQIDPDFPSPGALRRINSRLDGYPGLDMSDPNAPGMMALFSSTQLGRAPVLSDPVHADALLAVGYTFPTPITEADVAADIAAELAEIEAEQFAVQKRALGEQISADWNLRSNTLDAATSLADLPTLEQLRAVVA